MFAARWTRAGASEAQGIDSNSVGVDVHVNTSVLRFTRYAYHTRHTVSHEERTLLHP